jgi:hypothetical protein
MAQPIGQTTDNEQTRFSATPAPGNDPRFLSDVQFFNVGGTVEVWGAVGGYGQDPSTAMLEPVVPSGAPGPSARPIPLPGVRSIRGLDSSRAIAMTQSRLAVINLTMHSISFQTAALGSLSSLAIAQSGTIFVGMSSASSTHAGTVSSFTVDSSGNINPTGQSASVAFDPTTLLLISGQTGAMHPDEAVLALGPSESASGSLATLTASCTLSRKLDLPFAPSAAIVLADFGLAAIVGAASTRYFELDLGALTLSAPIAVPYFNDHLGLAFSSTRNRVYLSGNLSPGSDQGRVTMIDRSSMARRSDQGVISLPYPAGGLRVGLDATLYLIAPRDGFIVPLAIP